MRTRFVPLLRRHRRLTGASAIALAAAFVLLVAVPGHRLAAVIVPYPHEQAQVSFAIAGDVIPHEPVRAAAAVGGEGAQGWGALFSDVADVFEKADFGFVNMETPVAPAHSHGVHSAGASSADSRPSQAAPGRHRAPEDRQPENESEDISPQPSIG